MTKPVRILVVTTILLAMILLSWRIDPPHPKGTAVSVQKADSAPVPVANKNLVLLEFYSGL